MGKKPPTPWTPSVQAWSLVFEAGLGLTVLLGMLALWSSLPASQITSSTTLLPPRTYSPQLAPQICNRSLYPPPWTLRSDQLTILVNGFIESRLPLLQSTLRTYSSSPAVHSIFILWSNTSTPDSILESVNFETLRAPIFMVRQASTSLNDRFLPRDHVKTKAVMICDDDVTVDSSNVEFALEVWRENQGRIVGFFPRVHSYSFDSQSWIYVKNERKYSIMLTKIMILATEYLYKYWCEMPSGVREYVDQGMNCEDIAMNFLVSNLSNSGPLLVEGQPRDWGDSRNSGAKELTSMGLSARADHRKNRGDCILAFQRLWNGMQLRFSYSKAVRNVDEQVKCEKLGHLIDCDMSVNSVRDVLRHAGYHLVKRTLRFAYVTLLQSKGNFYAVLVWAQAIRNSGSVHDLVLLLDVRSGIPKDNDTLIQHFDLIKEVGFPETQHPNLGKLHAWELLYYERIVFMDLHLLPLSNLDFLFGLPEPSAAPLTSRPQEFHSGLLVLKPSTSTFTEVVKWWEGMEKAERKVPHRVLNGFFSEWFYMAAEHRLPLRFNMPLELTNFAPSRSSNWSESKPALPGVLQYPKRELVLMQAIWSNEETLNQTLALRHHEENQSLFTIWLEILSALRSNSYQPLDDEQISHLSWNSSTESSWSPRNPKPRHSPLPLNPKLRKAFATVLTSVDDLAAVGGWVSTFSRFHTSGQESLLLVHMSLNRQSWKPFETVFDSVVVVDSLLHLWNQTRYEKLVFVDPRSIFLRNCDSLMEMEAFAAAPDFVRPDTFSLQVMVIQPDHPTFLELSRRFSVADSTSMVQFLNEFHSFWYSSSPKHRIEAIFNAEGRREFQKGLEVDRKLFSFYSNSSLRDPETAVIWRKYVCDVHTRIMDALSKHLNLCEFKLL